MSGQRRKILFIDRDGTLIKEPADEQIDDFGKLVFCEGMIGCLSLIRKKTDYAFVLVSNQDGLGTSAFPEERFWPIHNFIIKTLEGEGIVFDEQLIDRHFASDNAPTRKPATGLVEKYMASEDYDIEDSYVIGDRESDEVFARNIGCGCLRLGKEGMTWERIAEIVIGGERKAAVRRKTSETEVCIELDLDGSGQCVIDTGIGFFDHMLEQIGRHAGIDLRVSVVGDLNVDEHHTVEDTALVLGECLKKAVGDKRGMERYGFVLPMDDALCSMALDFGGRPWIVWDVEFKRERIGDMPTEMLFHFFKSLSDTAMINLNVKAEGINEHHKAEAIFKAFARCLRMSMKRDPREMRLPTTKGVV